jgi:glucose/arabinose dehydrogenase
MSPGAHVLQLATVSDAFGVARESQLSASLNLVVMSRSSPPAVLDQRAPTKTAATDGTTFSLQILSTALVMPSAIAILPDGSVLIAEAAGDVRVWRDGAILAEPAFHLADSTAATDVGLIGMTLDPQFSANRWLYLAYTARRTNGAFVNRVIRVRVSQVALAEPVVLLEDGVPEAPIRTPRLKFGRDGKLYVAFPAGRSQSEAQNLATYSGKILRLNEDGTTPADNAGHSPIVSNGHRAAAFDWAPSANLSYRVERGWDGVDRLVAGLSPVADIYTFDSLIDPSNASFYQTGALTGFRGDLFIAGLDGRHLRRVRFDPRRPRKVLTTERLFDDTFGRISDVAAGPDGALYFCTTNANGGSTHDQLVRIAAPPP